MDKHTLETIERSTTGSLDGSLSFPETVGILMEVGVSRYRVDFPRAEKTTYLRNGESRVDPLAMPDEPIAEAFCAEGVANAVRASQTERLPFPQFLVRARQAGCVGYVVYLDGRRVVYSGALGDEHIEHFPSVP